IKDYVSTSLIDSYQFYQEYTIPAGDEAMYYLDQEIITVGIQNMIAVSPDLSEDLVYDLTERYYDYLGSDEVSVSALNESPRDDIAKDLVAPLHPGAEKFYEENGMLE